MRRFWYKTLATLKEEFSKAILILKLKFNKSLLQLTQERINALEGIQEPILICNEEHRFLVAEQMREINITPKTIYLSHLGETLAPQ